MVIGEATEGVLFEVGDVSFGIVVDRTSLIIKLSLSLPVRSPVRSISTSNLEGIFTS